MYQQFATIRTKTTSVARAAVGGTVGVTMPIIGTAIGMAITATVMVAGTITSQGPLCGVKRS